MEKDDLVAIPMEAKVKVEIQIMEFMVRPTAHLMAKVDVKILDMQTKIGIQIMEVMVLPTNHLMAKVDVKILDMQKHIDMGAKVDVKIPDILEIRMGARALAPALMTPATVPAETLAMDPEHQRRVGVMSFPGSMEENQRRVGVISFPDLVRLVDDVEIDHLQGVISLDLKIHVMEGILHLTEDKKVAIAGVLGTELAIAL